MTFRTNIPAVEDMIEYGGRAVAEQPPPPEAPE